MSPPVTNNVNTWLDESSATRPNPDQLEWPLTATREHKNISNISTNGVTMVCKSLPQLAFVGPDKHTRMYRIKHRKYRPLLPRMLLHNGPDDSSPIWAKYEAATLSKAWVEMPCRSTGSTSHGRVEVLRKRDGKRNKYVFTMMIRGAEETFGWRRSKDTMIKDLGLSRSGYKLVRLTKGAHHIFASTSDSQVGNVPKTSDRMQVVALAGRSHHALPRCIALQYLASFGDEWEVVSLVTLLAFWFWDRKRMMKG
ncbi:hypothetical protein GGR55DRAFT_199375 [Xylaria sp. FL0064]|nr:hypothetical protein GGR55DRAFT_199375 [Xylaria sp. FL0064]